MMTNLNSIKLLAVSERFHLYPQGEVDLEQFVNIMVGILNDTEASTRPDFAE